MHTSSATLTSVLLSLFVIISCRDASGDIILANPGVDDRIVAITDVVVTGTDFDAVYNFYFHYDTTYDDFEALHAPSSPIVWTNTSQAGAVIDSLTDMVIAFGDVGPIRTQGMLLSRGLIGANNFDPVIQIDRTNNYSQWRKDSFLQGGGLSRTQNFGTQTAFLSTSVSASAVPEPSSLVTLSLAGICFGAYRCRRPKPRK